MQSVRTSRARFLQVAVSIGAKCAGIHRFHQQRVPGARERGGNINLQVEITGCDQLLVKGSVEATLTDGKTIDSAHSCTFNGAVECETASIRGKFEGDLTCTERLVVRSTGRIIGKIRYRQLEVERGGELSGDVQMIQGGAAAQATVTPIFGESEDSRMDPIAAVVSGDR